MVGWSDILHIACIEKASRPRQTAEVDYSAIDSYIDRFERNRDRIENEKELRVSSFYYGRKVCEKFVKGLHKLIKNA